MALVRVTNQALTIHVDFTCGQIWARLTTTTTVDIRFEPVLGPILTAGGLTDIVGAYPAQTVVPLPTGGVIIAWSTVPTAIDIRLFAVLHLIRAGCGSPVAANDVSRRALIPRLASTGHLAGSASGQSHKGSQDDHRNGNLSWEDSHHG